MRILVINRHALTWTVGRHGSHLAASPDDVFLITRTFGDGLTGFYSRDFPHVAVLDMSDNGRLEAVARWAIESRRIERIVSLHEKDLLLVARLREEFGLPGMDTATTLRFRDKILMKDTLLAAGYTKLPRYRALGHGEEVTSVPWQGPSVVKSRWGVGSSEVRIVEDMDTVNRAARELEAGAADLEIEEYVEGRMYHCDAVVHEGEILFAAVCEYVAQPGRFSAGAMAGSVVLTRGELREAVLSENRSVLAILGMSSGVTHVEFFRRPSGELVFCEAAARPGGGGIDDIINRTYGVELIHAAVTLQCGGKPDVRSQSGATPASFAGVLGFYHSDDRLDRPLPELAEEVPGVASYAFSRQEVAGSVRHCTDYAHKIILTATDRDEFDKLARTLARRISGNAALAQSPGEAR